MMIARGEEEAFRALAPAPSEDRSCASDVLDAATLTKLEALLGGDKTTDLMSKLATMLQTVLTAEAIAASDPAQLARLAHMAVSGAGMLGFLRFARACAELEAACRARTETLCLRESVTAERDAVLQRLMLVVARV